MFSWLSWAPRVPLGSPEHRWNTKPERHDGEVKTVPWPSGNKIHERHDGEVKTVPCPPGNKIHERHNGEVKTVSWPPGIQDDYQFSPSHYDQHP